MGWHFVPWSIQYIIGGVIALIISLYVFKKGMKIRSHQCFFLFGLCTTIWLFTVYFARNAPSEYLSKEIYRIVGTSFMLIQPLILITLLFIRKGKKAHFLTLAPAIIVALSVLVLTPYEVIWTGYGWTYMLWPSMALTCYSLVILYLLAIITVGYLSIKKITIPLLKRKFKLILFGVLIYLSLLIVANFILFLSPGSPPFGGILVFVEFLFIAYAITLPTEKLEKKFPTAWRIHAEEKKLEALRPLAKVVYQIRRGDLSDSLGKFLEDLLKAMPGRELGQNLLEFDNFLNYTGLNKVVSFKKGKIMYHEGKISSLNLFMSVDKAVEYMEKRKWAIKAIGSLSNLILNVYYTVRLSSVQAAKEWLFLFTRKHKDFLSAHDILSRLPSSAELRQHKA